MFRIGEFANLNKISIKTLRYYDELGLLKPMEVDWQTGYRYYSAAGSNRELYLEGEWSTQNIDEYITEIQIPVKKI